MSEKKATQKKITAKKIVLWIFAAIFITVVCLCFIEEKPEQFTEEQHIAKLSRRVKKRIKKELSSYTYTFDYDSFEIYPLYNENDELKYFIVEFEPGGFVFVYMIRRFTYINIFFGEFGDHSLYRHGSLISEWSRFTVDANKSFSYDNFIYEVDENGEKIVYDKSPYYVAGIENERRYLLYNRGGYIPAVRRDGEFLNLVSMTKVLYDENGDFLSKQATIHTGFVGKPEFSL